MAEATYTALKIKNSLESCKPHSVAARRPQATELELSTKRKCLRSPARLRGRWAPDSTPRASRSIKNLSRQPTFFCTSPTGGCCADETCFRGRLEQRAVCSVSGKSPFASCRSCARPASAVRTLVTPNARHCRRPLVECIHKFRARAVRDLAAETSVFEMTASDFFRRRPLVCTNLRLFVCTP